MTKPLFPKVKPEKPAGIFMILCSIEIAGPALKNTEEHLSAAICHIVISVFFRIMITTKNDQGSLAAKQVWKTCGSQYMFY